MGLTSFQIIEIDALVLMGILILVTFLNTNLDDSFSDKLKNQGFDLIIEREKINEFLLECTDNNLTNSEIITECDKMQIRLVEINAEFLALQKTANVVLERTDDYADASIYKSAPEWIIVGFIEEPISRINNANFWSAILIIPFAISAAYESINSRRKETDAATNTGLNAMIIGFFLMFPLLFVVLLAS